MTTWSQFLIGVLNTCSIYIVLATHCIFFILWILRVLTDWWFGSPLFVLFFLFIYIFLLMLRVFTAWWLGPNISLRSLALILIAKFGTNTLLYFVCVFTGFGGLPLLVAQNLRFLHNLEYFSLPGVHTDTRQDTSFDVVSYSSTFVKNLTLSSIVKTSYKRVYG